MGDQAEDDRSAAAKLVQVVLANCGPLSATEVAEEAYLEPERALAGLEELEREGVAEPVCGVCEAREEVYALVDRPRQPEPSA
ncbi:MAG: hypothetical protein GWN07_12800 [Actinobacteria bacterium]|nr:hypothetical protein [Actinomycetota bacterium]NIU66343.1 hypothetical protein [Actinomycetota bacterium]NIW30130.1 hypothetical protein [Actinomycetota bacterium]NIX20654.1 hypothetical protein [Actinomycetota bacterium]